MEKMLTNINVSQICSITSYLKRRNPWYIYKKSKRVLFFWNRKEGYYNFGWLDSDVYTTIDEIEKKNKHLYCEDDNVYYKPYVEIKMSNGDEFEKNFETKEELYLFMECEDLKKVVWIKL